jgi:hypothetical protein
MEERIMRTLGKIAATLGVVGVIAVGSVAPAAAWYGYNPYYYRHYGYYHPYHHYYHPYRHIFGYYPYHRHFWGGY